MLIETGEVYEYLYAIQLHDELWHLCGYLGVFEGHPWYGKKYGEIDADVHGGLTYAQLQMGDYPAPCKADVWWVGFDCGHFGDFTPGILRWVMESETADSSFNRVYERESQFPWRDRDYVFDEIVLLAQQALTEDVHARSAS